MILKIIIFAVLIAVIYFKFFHKSLPKEKKSGKKGSDANEEIMVECSKCGTYISNNEAIIKDNRYYCSTECERIAS